MELGKSVDQSGKAAFKPEDTRAHSIAASFAGNVGYDGCGCEVAAQTPNAGIWSDHGTAPMDDGRKNS
jgi:hypothetical protein